MVQINLTYEDTELLIEAVTATINEARMYQENFERTTEDLIENFKGRMARKLGIIFYSEDNKQQENNPIGIPNDLIGTQVRQLMRAATSDKPAHDTIHFMYNDYKVIIEKMENCKELKNV